MWLRKGELVAGLEALSAAATVALMAWYAVARAPELAARLGRLDDITVGLVTVIVVLTAGGLLAFAFARAEDAMELARRRASEKSGASG